MGMVSTALHNSRETNKLPLRKVVALTKLSTSTATQSNYELTGECGHRLGVIAGTFEHEAWSARLEAGKRNKKRCLYCGTGLAHNVVY